MEMQHLLVVGVVMLAGFMRGITGFGGAALMAPLLSAMLGPVQAVVTALTLETAAALIMFPDAWPRFNRRVLLYLTIPACVTVPIGGYLLVNVDAFIMRKVIAGVAVIPFLIATWLGGKLFGKMNELVARRTALSLMLFMGVIGLLV